MTYSQWDSTHRTAIRTHTTHVEEFIELLVYNIDNLTTHSFIAKSQTRYLKSRKSEIDDETCIILLDFAENYHYIVQDEVQGYHWNKDQCTLHPVVIYYKNEQNELEHISMCILTDDLNHAEINYEFHQGKAAQSKTYRVLQRWLCWSVQKFQKSDESLLS